MKEARWRGTLEYLSVENIIEVAKSGAAFETFRRAYGDLYLMAKGYNAGCVDMWMRDSDVNILYCTDDGKEYVETINIAEFGKTLQKFNIEYSYKVRPRE